MCKRRNSGHGLKRTAILFLLFLLAVSPCFAVASWSALFHGGSSGESSGQEATLPEASTKDSYLTKSANQYLPSGNDSLEELKSQLKQLKAEQESLNQKAKDLASLSQTLSVQLEDYVLTGEISEAQYLATKESLDSAEKLNKDQAETIDTLRQLVAKDEALLKTKTKTLRGFITLSPVVGVSDNFALSYGVGADVGIIFKDTLMFGIGAEYMIGDLSHLVYTPTVQNTKFRASIGWVF